MFGFLEDFSSVLNSSHQKNCGCAENPIFHNGGHHRCHGRLVAQLSGNGVSLLAGSDSGAFNSYVYPGISLHRELQELVDNGLSPLEALRTSAYNGSKFLGKNAEYGSISIGNASDLVILENNPLENIRNTKSVDAVIKGAQVFDSKALKELLDMAVRE